MVETLAGTQEIDVDKLDPNDPKVFADPNLLRLLPPTQQMIGIINLAQSGQIVNGNETMTLEAILAGAGYDVDIDGQFSPAEMAALQNFEDKLNDRQFKEAGEELLRMVTNTQEGQIPLLPSFGLLGPVLSPTAPTQDNAPNEPTPAQTAAAKILMKMMPGV